MFNLNGKTGISAKFLNRMFRQIDGLNWDLQTGAVGVKTRDGSIATLVTTNIPGTAAVSASGTGDNAVAAVAAVAGSTEYGISVNPFEMFATPIPAFATQVPFDRIGAGDLIVGDTEILGWVVGKTAKALKLLDFKGFQKTYQPPKVQILNQDGALVVQSLTGMFGGNAGLGGLQNSLMPLMLMSGGSSEGLESVLPLLLFSQLQTANPAAAADAAAVGGNPALAQSPIAGMLPFLLLSQGKKKGATGKSGGLLGGMDPMMMMMMSGGMGGGAAAGGMNPMMLMALAQGGFGSDDGDDEPELVSIPKTRATGGFTPALEALPKRRAY